MVTDERKMHNYSSFREALVNQMIDEIRCIFCQNTDHLRTPLFGTALFILTEHKRPKSTCLHEVCSAEYELYK